MKINLSENLKLLRKKAKLSQEDIAEEFGLSSQSVSKWENGVSCPDISLLPEIAEFYEVSVDELLGYESLTSLNSIYLKMESLVNDTTEDDEKIELIYRLSKLINSSTTEAKNLSGANSQSVLQTFGKENGGVVCESNSSMFASLFSDLSKIKIDDANWIYDELVKYCDLNSLKVLCALFNKRILSREKDGAKVALTIDEIKKATKLNDVDILPLLNNINAKSDSRGGWYLDSLDLLPLLLMFASNSKSYREK